MLLLKNPYVQLGDNYIKLVTEDHVHRVATLLTLYDLGVQVAIGALLFRRRAPTSQRMYSCFFHLHTTSQRRLALALPWQCLDLP